VWWVREGSHVFLELLEVLVLRGELLLELQKLFFGLKSASQFWVVAFNGIGEYGTFSFSRWRIARSSLAFSRFVNESLLMSRVSYLYLYHFCLLRVWGAPEQTNLWPVARGAPVSPPAMAREVVENAARDCSVGRTAFKMD
jgi:hypothetical protein